MKIIQASLQQLDELVELFDAYRVWYRKSSDKIQARDFLQNRIEQQDSVVYLAVTEEGKSVGFTQLYPIFSSVQMRRMWLLNDLFVAPDFRGQGISKQLINRAKDLCRSTDACGILLETEVSNLIGNQLYPSADFDLYENRFYYWTNK